MSFPSSSDLRFSIAGPIVSWDQHGRWLRIGVRNFWLSPGVSVAGLVQGARVTAIGYQDDATALKLVVGGSLVRHREFAERLECAVERLTRR